MCNGGCLSVYGKRGAVFEKRTAVFGKHCAVLRKAVLHSGNSGAVFMK